jgi:hypothetical protein
MTNERDTVCFAHKTILLLLYAWNSCPILGTNLSCSLVAVGRKFAFLIDYSTKKHWELTSSPNSMESYSQVLAMRVSAHREVSHLLVQEQEAYHQELINSRQPDPHIYSVDENVFARHAIQSDARIDNLQYAFTGLWCITEALKGALNELKHSSTPSRKKKRHASDLSPYPTKLIPLEHVDGPYTPCS